MGSWFSSMFAEVAKVFGETRSMRFLMVGLDNAGKTTILYALKLGEVVSTAPTVGFNVEEITVSGITMSVWDIGGQTKLRQCEMSFLAFLAFPGFLIFLFPTVWKHYYDGTVAVIFVVDSSDRERFPEARNELEQMGSDSELRDWTLLVLANKSDLPNAASVAELSQELGLTGAVKGPQCYHVQQCCALKKEGIQEGFAWLADTLKKRKN